MRADIIRSRTVADGVPRHESRRDRDCDRGRPPRPGVGRSRAVGLAATCLLFLSFASLSVALVGCGTDPSARLAEARTLQEAGDFSSSVEPLREVLAQEPDDPEANYLLGLALVQTQQPSLAIWPLRKAADSESYGVVGGLLLAAMLFQTEGFEEAIATLDQLLEKAPDHTGALVLRANSNMQIGRNEDALADADHLLEIEPENFQGLLARATALQKLGRLEESEATWIELSESADASGDPGLAAQGCSVLFGFYASTESEKAPDVLQRCVEAHPDNALILQRATEYYTATGDTEAAVALWRQVVEDEPDSYEARTGLAAQLERAGDLEGAEASLVETAELFDDARAYDGLARFYQKHEDNEKALAALEQALDRASGDRDPLLFRKADLLATAGELDRADEVAEQLEQPVYREIARGRILYERGDYEQALEVLESGLVQWPNNAGARYLAGQAAEQLGDQDRAVAHYREATRKGPEQTNAALAVANIYLSRGAWQDAATMAKRHTDHRGFTGPEAHQIAARAFVRLGLYDQARATLDDLDKSEQYPAAAAVERAAVERQAQGPEAAVAVLESSGLDLADPDNEAALRAMVDHLLAAGRADAALALIDTALAADAARPSVHDLQGRVLASAGRTDDARAAFQRALEIDEGYVAARQALAQLAMRDADLDAALAFVEGLDDSESRYTVAQIYLARGQGAEAEARLRALLEDDRNHAVAANDLAWLLAERKAELDEARELAERAVHLDGRAEFHDTLGWVLFQRGDFAGAEESFRAALAQDAEAASVRYRLGLTLEALGRSDEAQVELRQALGGGTFPEADAARAELARLEAGAQARP